MSLYTTKRWRQMRAAAYVASCGKCAMCGDMVTRRDPVDHIVPHRGDRVLFFSMENIQVLCLPCHASRKQSDERRGYSSEIGLDGLPTDPLHPVHLRR